MLSGCRPSLVSFTFTFQSDNFFFHLTLNLWKHLKFLLQRVFSLLCLNFFVLFQSELLNELARNFQRCRLCMCVFALGRYWPIPKCTLLCWLFHAMQISIASTTWSQTFLLPIGTLIGSKRRMAEYYASDCIPYVLQTPDKAVQYTQRWWYLCVKFREANHHAGGAALLIGYNIASPWPLLATHPTFKGNF